METSLPNVHTPSPLNFQSPHLYHSLFNTYFLMPLNPTLVAHCTCPCKCLLIFPAPLKTKKKSPSFPQPTITFGTPKKVSSFMPFKFALELLLVPFFLLWIRILLLKPPCSHHMKHPLTKFVLVQWSGLAPEDTSWEHWDTLRASYNLEDKVIFPKRGDVSNTIHKEHTRRQKM